MGAAVDVAAPKEQVVATGAAAVDAAPPNPANENSMLSRKKKAYSRLKFVLRYQNIIQISTVQGKNMLKLCLSSKELRPKYAYKRYA